MTPSQTTGEEQVAAPRPRTAGLWRNADFLKLWTGETVSLVGSQVTALALPLTAALTLGATPGQMGVLGAVEAVPWPLLGLLAGVWVDRLRRRPLLMATDLVRAVLLAAVPAAALLGVLRMEVLYVVAFLAGIGAVFFEVAYNAFLPTLVPRADLVDGNSKLQASASVAEVAGPGLAGAFVQAVGAPFAVLADAASFLVAAGFLARIRTHEPPIPPAAGRSIRREIREGLGALLHNPLLRTLVIVSTLCNLFFAMQGAARVLYATRELGMAPALLGVVLAAGSLGGLPAALLAGRIARRFGIGPTIVASTALMGAGALLVPLANGPPALAALPFVAGLILTELASTTYIITVGSLRQAITPDRLQGRIAATARFLSRSAVPVGFLLGGLLGEWIGLRATLIIPASGPLLVSVWLLRTPLRALRDPPIGTSD